jgi:hypothetical protein
MKSPRVSLGCHDDVIERLPSGGTLPHVVAVIELNIADDVPRTASSEVQDALVRKFVVEQQSVAR